MKRLVISFILIITICCVGAAAQDFNMEIVHGQRRCVKIVSVADSLTGDTLVVPKKVRIGKRNYIVKYIGAGAFQFNDRIKTAILPKTVISIGQKAFFGCTNLREIVFPEKLHNIEAMAFCDCRSLQQICLPEHLDSIGESAFRFCTSLETVIIPDNVTHIGDRAFEGGDGISIFSDSPYGNSRLKTVVLGKGIRELGDRTFAFHSLETIHIPENVRTIGPRTFGTPYTLTEVWCHSKTPPVIEKGNKLDWIPYDVNHSFEFYDFQYHSTMPVRTLHVPAGCREAYLEADGWNVFDNIVDDCH